MMCPLERRQVWSRLVGVERRAAPLHELNGHPLPDPTRLEDEDFLEARIRQEDARRELQARFDRWGNPS